MRFFVLLTLIFVAAFAQERPKIALVLSGGGARGGAHVGVLKVLEQNRVPIDMVVGTSMGSLVGGLYAAGKTPQEIEKILVDTKWEDYIKTDFDRQNIPMRRKKSEYTYQGRLGFGINAENEPVFPTGVLKREPLLLKFDELTSSVKDIKDFDHLSIPFRAVATNIKNGDAVVLKSGSLAKAIYASSAIPGGLQPIEIDGIDLVDGGVSDNIPVDVARKMGADIIIVVDVSENFSETLDVNSYLVVVGQLVNILMRKNANESLLKLTKKDLLIAPKLEGYSGLDVSKYPQIIEAGYEAANRKKKVLQELALTPKAYTQYRKYFRQKQYAKNIVVDEIKINNTTYIDDAVIRKNISQEIGKKLDTKKLTQDILALYHLTIFDSITYDIQRKNGKNILLITTKPSWNNHGDVFFSISLDDDFQGHSAYSLKVGYFMYGINALGAEWRTDFEIGKRQRFYSEFYQPLDEKQLLYLQPFLSYEQLTYLIPTKSIGNQELRSTGYGGGMGVGANINRSFRIEGSLSAYKDRSEVALYAYDKNFISKQATLQFLYDSLDNYNFASRGFLGTLRLKKDAKSWGSDYDYEQLYCALQKPFTYKDNTLIFNAKIGLTDLKSQQTQQITVYDKFFLGGMFNLSGYQKYSFARNNIVFANVMYRYKIKNGGFFGSLGMPLYAGATLESGNTWDDKQTFKASSLKYAASLFVAADTPLGAFYFTYGAADVDHQSLYLYLGEKF